MPRDVVLHGALLEGTGTQMDKPLTRIFHRMAVECWCGFGAVVCVDSGMWV